MDLMPPLLLQDWTSIFDSQALQPLKEGATILNLALALLLGQVLSFHYRRFAKVLSNKRKFAPILVFIAATTMLVISVVKTSLALSLGLVGALSIIRFRTPIKEPEELAYLFLAVALGVGMGADQRLATAIMFLGILAFMTLINGGKPESFGSRTMLHIASDAGSGDRASTVDKLLSAIKPHAAEVDLRRIDVNDSTFEASLIVDMRENIQIGTLLDSVQGAFPSASVSVVEADGLD